MILKFIYVPIFILSLLVGLLFVFLSPPQQTKIYVYPTPDNVDDIEYSDNANICHKFEASEVTCMGENIKTIPIQY